MTYIEKIAWTIPAKIWGIQVFWAHHAPLGKWFWNNPYKNFWKFLSRFVKIIVPSVFLRSELTKIAKNDIKVLWNPLEAPKNLKKFKKISQENEKIVVGTASRLSPEKNIDSVVFLAEKFPKILFQIAGEGPEKQKILQLYEQKKLKNIEFLGFLNPEKMHEFFSSIDILYFPSCKEPFGLIAGEAMLHEKMILTSGVDGILEVVGEHAEVFSLRKDNAAEKLQKILDLSSEERKRRGEEGRKWIDSNFSSKIFEEKFLQVFTD